MFDVVVVVFILTLPFLYENSKLFRYYFKFFVYYGIVSLTAVFVIPIMALRPKEVKNLFPAISSSVGGHMDFTLTEEDIWTISKLFNCVCYYQEYCMRIASSICHYISDLLGLKWELRGEEHLAKEQACIIVANHQSSIDILVIFEDGLSPPKVPNNYFGHVGDLTIHSFTVPAEGTDTEKKWMFDIWPIMDKCTVVAKKELFYAWPFGLAAWLCGLIFIDRMNSEKARIAINAATSHIKEKKIKLWIFPEGTRNNIGTIMPFKKGAFHVAISSQIPILPVVFSSYYFLDNGRKDFGPGHVIISTLAPIPTAGLAKDDVEVLMNDTRNKMLEVYESTSNEIKASVFPILSE